MDVRLYITGKFYHHELETFQKFNVNQQGSSAETSKVFADLDVEVMKAVASLLKGLPLGESNDQRYCWMSLVNNYAVLWNNEIIDLSNTSNFLQHY
jgi:hypothetical protein